MSVEGIGPAAVPPEVRNSKAYTAALGFERMLLEQLTKPLAKSALGGGEDSGAEDSETDPHGGRC